MMSHDLTLLHIEDNIRDGARFQKICASLDVPVRHQSFGSVDEAIDYLWTQIKSGGSPVIEGPTLMVLSLPLARKSDFKLLRWLKGQPLLRKILIVVLAVSRQPLKLDQALDLGAVTFLVKPVAPEELRSIIQATLHCWELERRFPKAPAKAKA